jgi:hypothetical protein
MANFSPTQIAGGCFFKGGYHPQSDLKAVRDATPCGPYWLGVATRFGSHPFL